MSILIFLFMTLIPGFLILRLLRINKLNITDACLYSVGLSLLFNIAVGFIANYTFGVNHTSVFIIYCIIVSVLVMLNIWLGKLQFDWDKKWNLAGIIIPCAIYLTSVLLLYQTTLISSNLVGSDIHFEYFYANQVLENGHWAWQSTDSAVNSCAGVVFMLPVYSLLTNIDLVWIFKVICPLIFAILPVVLYKIFKMQFGTLVSVLAVMFFVTMPMFTMDIAQLIRQQQSEVFLALTILPLLVDTLSFKQKVILSSLFSLGIMVAYYGMAIGFTYYLLIGSFLIVLLVKFWKRKPLRYLKSYSAFFSIALISVILFFSYYSLVADGKIIGVSKIPTQAVGDAVANIRAGVLPNSSTTSKTKPPSPEAVYRRTLDVMVSSNVIESTSKKVEPMNEYFANPSTLDLLLRTAIGVDFSDATILGKVWRIFQYLIELCLIIGILVLFIKPFKKVRMEFLALILASTMILVSTFVLPTNGFLGGSRLWHVTLLFMSPLFVVGATVIGKGLMKLCRVVVVKDWKLVLASTMILFIPYFTFNSGAIFELTKSELTDSHIDIPYSLSMSSYRIDLSTRFEKEDIEAIDWFRANHEQLVKNKFMFFADAHGICLFFQRVGYEPWVYDTFRYMSTESKGYMFLRKWNVDNHKITIAPDYAMRVSCDLSAFHVLEDKINNGEVIFDNGARIILIK